MYFGVKVREKLVAGLGLKTAPTLIVGDDRYTGVPGVRDFIKKVKGN